jgi:hypothetical protein
MQSYRRIGLQANACQRSADGPKGLSVCVLSSGLDSVSFYPLNWRQPVGNMQGNVEFRIMPSGKGGWYWEVIAHSRSVVSRGLADTQSAASEEASEAARKAKLGDGNIWMPYDGL